MTHKQKITIAAVLYKERGFWVLHWLPRTRVLHWEEKPSEYSSLKASRTYFHKIQKLVETGSTLKGYTQNLTCSGIQPQPTKRKASLRPPEPTAAPGHIPAHQMAEDLPPHASTCAWEPDPHGLTETPGPRCRYQWIGTSPRIPRVQAPPISKPVGFPGGSDGKASACNAGDWVRSLGQEDPLEKEMATHCSILAWRIPWMEEPGGL